MNPRSERLSVLLAQAGVRPIDPPAVDPEIRGVSIDSRKIGPGGMFFALRGMKADGEAFVSDALSRGATAIVASSEAPAGLATEAAWVRVDDPRRVVGPVARAWFGRPDESMTVVGITGTNGKTTVSYLVEAIARAAGRTAGRVGTISYAFAGREFPAERTTPEATDLFELLAIMLDAGTDVVAMEVSSHALALHRVEGVRFSIAAFLNLGRDHLDFHGSREAYLDAKARLFESLGPAARAVLPADDPSGASIAGRTRARVLTFGRAAESTVRIREELSDTSGSSATLVTPEGDIAVRTHLLGRFNLDNVAAAAACSLAMGISGDAVAEGVRSLGTVPGRVERIDCGQPFTVLVDYAHTEQALERLLGAMRELTPGRLIVVFGCGGDRDRGKREGMGRVAGSAADRIFLTSDNPRGEDPEAILRDVARGVESIPGVAERARIVPDRSQAVIAALRWASPGDTVVVAGKGHETTQTFSDRVERIDDRDLARQGLASLGWSDNRRADA